MLDFLVPSILLCPKPSSVLITSFYLPYDVAHIPSTEDMSKVVQFAKKSGFQAIFACNANAHNVTCGRSDTNTRDDALLEYFFTENLQVVNTAKIIEES